MFIVSGPEMIVIFNEPLQDLVGKRLGEALGRPLRDLWGPIWPQVGGMVERAYAGEAFLARDVGLDTWVSGHSEHRYFSFAWTPLKDLDKRFAGPCCICHETTDTVLRHERALAQRAGMLAMLDDSSSFALATEGADHRVIYANAAFERLTSRTIPLGTAAGEVFPEAARQGVLKLLNQVYESGRGVRQDRHQYEVERADGSIELRVVNTVFQPIYTGSDQPVGVFVLGEDESAEIAAESQAQSLQAELIHASRVNALGALSSAIAHELNQPLATIANYTATAELLLEQGAAQPVILDCLKEVSKSALRAGDIIRSLREMVRKGAPKRELFTLHPIVADSVRLTRVSDLAHGHVEIDVPGELCVWGDPTQIEQVLLNLIRNAIESSGPAGGAVRVSARSRRDMVEIAVTDSGPGIPPDRLDDIFDAFATSKDHGLGLGLSICRTIVEAHGGQIVARNNRAGGATFSFNLPGGQPV
jgi:C4-dicarboxylate-specific signal transduction histidine kinase